MSKKKVVAPRVVPVPTSDAQLRKARAVPGRKPGRPKSERPKKRVRVPTPRPKPSTKRSARLRHVEEAFRLATVGDNIEGAMKELRLALNESRPGVKSKAGEITQTEAYTWGYNGNSHVEIAAILGVQEKTWAKYRKQRPELQEEYDRGRANMGTGLRREILRMIKNGSFPALKFALTNYTDMKEQINHIGEAPDQQITVNFVAQQPEATPKQIAESDDPLDRAKRINEVTTPQRFG